MGALNHVNIASEDADDLAARFREFLDLELVKETVVEDQGVRVLMLSAGGANLEITEPLGPDTPVGKFLSRRGAGLHHLAFEVPDIEEALRRLKSAGLRLVDEEPRIGAEGHRIAFVHPQSFGGVLVELVETGEREEEG